MSGIGGRLFEATPETGATRFKGLVDFRFLMGASSEKTGHTVIQFQRDHEAVSRVKVSSFRMLSQQAAN